MTKVCENCGKIKEEHHINPFTGNYCCEFGEDNNQFKLKATSKPSQEKKQ